MDQITEPDGADTTPAAERRHVLVPHVRDLVAEIFADGSAALHAADGTELRAERIASYRDVVLVHVRRLVLEPDLVVTGRCETPHPWSVTFVVREVEPFSASTETATLEAIGASLYPERRLG